VADSSRASQAIPLAGPRWSAKKELPNNLKRLFELRDDPDTRATARLGAIKELNDRALGKPAQAVTGEGGIGAGVVEVFTGILRSPGDPAGEQGQTITVNVPPLPPERPAKEPSETT